MIPVPDKILGVSRNSIHELIKRKCCAKSGFYFMDRHKEHVLIRTGHYMYMPARNRYPTQAARSDVFKAGLEFYRSEGIWCF